MTSRPIHPAVPALRHRIARTLILRYGLGAMAVWTFAWGTMVLALRVGWHVDRPTLAYGAIGLIGAIMVAIILALRKLPTDQAIRAAVDRHARAGGLVMAAEETDISAWPADHAAPISPSVQWNGRRTRWMVLASVLFVAGAFAIPDRVAQGLIGSPLDITDQARPIEQQITLLEQKKIIEQDSADSMRQKLDQIRRDARGSDPARTWESLDQMRHTLEQSAKQAAEEAMRQAEPLAKAEAMADAISQADQQNKADAQSLADAMRQLNDQLAQSAAVQQAMDQQLKKDLANGEKPESHYKLDIERAQRLIEKAKALEPLVKKDPKTLTPAEMAKLAELAMELKQLDESQLKQLAALGATDQMLKRLPPDSIAVVDAKAKATFFTRDPRKVKTPDMTVAQRFAARVHGGADDVEMFELAKLDPGVADLFNWPGDLFEGQPLAIEHDPQGKLIVFSGLPSTPVEWDHLEKLDGEHIIAVEPGKQPQLFGPVDVPPCNGQCSGKAGDISRAVRAGQMSMLQKLGQAGLIDPSQAGQYQAQAQFDSKALAQLLAQQGKLDGSQLRALADAACNTPGNGGVSRGRGDAPLTWKDPANTENVRMQSHVLPPASLAALKDSQQVGVSTGAPQTETIESSTGGALNAAQADAGQANTAVILPEHRAAVQRYFQHE